MVIHNPRIPGELTNLWELIQAAYEEDRCRTHEHNAEDQVPTLVKEAFDEWVNHHPWVAPRRTDDDSKQPVARGVQRRAAVPTILGERPYGIATTAG